MSRVVKMPVFPVYIREEKNLLVNIENWISGDE